MDDMFNAAATLQSNLPRTAVLLLDGPVKSQIRPEKVAHIRQRNPGFNPDRSLQWVSERRALGVNISYLKAAFMLSSFRVLQDINREIDRTARQLGITDDKIAVFGFSMGGIVGTYAALRRAQPCAAVVSHSGALCVTLCPIYSRPPILTITGQEDRLLRSGPFHHSVGNAFAGCQGLKVESLTPAGLGHEMTPETLAVSSAFLAKHLRL